MGLLKGINPLLSADLLYVLRSMGHGDKICICDCNFPAASTSNVISSSSGSGGNNKAQHIVLSVTLPEALDAICSVLPIDHFVDCAVYYMAPQNNGEMPKEGKEVIDEAKEMIYLHSSPSSGDGGDGDNSTGDDDKKVNIQPMDRFKFYDEAKTCFAIVQTMERRPYGNIIIQKGVIGPDGQDLKP
jgi:L-fucose mutarotase